MAKLEDAEEIQSIEEIFEKVVENIRANILAALFQYNFIPESNEKTILDNDEHDMEVIRLYRGLFTKACTQKLFDMIDEKIKSKFKIKP